MQGSSLLHNFSILEVVNLMPDRASTRRHVDENKVDAEQVLQAVKALSAELHPRHKAAPPVTLKSLLDRDLGFDSLGRVELLARIERLFEIVLPEHIFTSAETVEDLLRAVLEAAPAGKASSTRLHIIEESAVGAEEALVPRVAQTLTQVLAWHIERHPERPHIHLYRDQGEGEVLTYKALNDQAAAVAIGLQQAGLTSRQAVAIMLPTGRDYFLSFFGALLAGGIPVPLYPPARPAQVEEHLRRQVAILANSQAAVLITVPEAKVVSRLLAVQVPALRSVVTLAELAGNAGTLERRPTLRAEELALIQYTSGSTGSPKGVMLSHQNLLANVRSSGEAIGASARDVFVSWLPLYHDMGLIGAWLGSLYFGIPLVIMSPLAFLSRPERWLWAIHYSRGTLSAAPNFAYELCVRRISPEKLEGLDLSSWRLAFNGAETVSPSTVKSFIDRFAPFGFRPQSMSPVYGLAECAVGLAFPPLGRAPVVDRVRREPLTRAGHAIPADPSDKHALGFVGCGRALPRHEIRIVDSSGHELPERQEGKLQFRGPSATRGYYRNPEETRRLFDGDWLESGDRAYIVDGDVYITGRTKDIIIRGGRNIYPHEVEQGIGQLPGIRQGCVAVFGSTDIHSGTERVIVLAETREDDPSRRTALRAEVNAVAADLIGMPPDEVQLVAPHTVLKTSSGKIRRLASRGLYERGEFGRRPRSVWWQLTRIALASVLPSMHRLGRNITARLYSVYAWCVLVLLAIPTWIMVVGSPRPNWRFAIIRKAFAMLARAVGWGRLVRGLENLPPMSSPCVFVANHASYLDGAVIFDALPRPLSFVAKAELAAQFVAGTFLRCIGTEFVERFDRQKGRADAVRLAQVAQEGRSLCFFPEGRLTRLPGLLPFHMGAFLAAATARLPVVPIAIRGSRSILHPNAWFFRRGNVVVTIGQPIHPSDESVPPNADLWDIALTLRERAREHIASYCGESDLGHEELPT
jgi:1-acyl-sn-glycerol-3-phosphate acyltransferase